MTSLAQASEELGVTLRAVLGEAVRALVVLGAQQVVLQGAQCDLLHAATFVLGAPAERVSLVVAEAEGHRHAVDDTNLIPHGGAFTRSATNGGHRPPTVPVGVVSDASTPSTYPESSAPERWPVRRAAGRGGRPPGCP